MKDLENNKNKEGQDILPSTNANFHARAILTFFGLGVAGGLFYRFLGNPFALFAQTPVSVSVTATENSVVDARMGEHPEARTGGTCPSVNYDGVQIYSRTGDQLSPAVVFAGNNTANFAFLDDKTPLWHVMGGSVSMANPFPSSSGIFLDLSASNKLNPAIARSGNETYYTYDDGSNAFRQTETNATAGTAAQYISFTNAAGFNFRGHVDATDNVVGMTYASQEATLNNNYQIIARMFAPDNTPLTGDILVSTNMTKIHDKPKFTINRNNSNSSVITGVITYLRQTNSSTPHQILSRQFNFNLATKAMSFQGESVTSAPSAHHDCINPTVTFLNNNKSVTLFLTRDVNIPAVTSFTPAFQITNADGSKNPLVLLSPYIVKYNVETLGITPVSDGFMLTFADRYTTGLPVIHFNKYDNNGVFQGSFTAPGTSSQLNPALVTMANDCILANWQQDNGLDYDIATQISCPTITVVNTGTTANTYIQDAGSINFPPLYIPTVNTYTLGTVTINITIPANAGTISAGGFTSVNGVLTLTANNAQEANNILKCIIYDPATHFGGSFTAQITVSDGVSPTVTTNIPVTGIPINIPPTVQTDLIFGQGDTITVTPAMFNITDIDTIDANLTVTISNPNNGYFQKVVNGTTTPNILQFTKADIVAGYIQLVDAGNAAPFSFQYSIKDINPNGTNNLGPFTPTIQYTSNQPPSLLLNQQFHLAQNGTYVLTNQTLRITDPNNSPAQLTVNVPNGNVLHGQIEKYNSVTGQWGAVTSFTQDDVNHEIIRVHADDSGQTPVVIFTYTDGIVTSTPQSLNIQFNARPDFSLASFTVNTITTPITENNILTHDDNTPDQLIYNVPSISEGHFANINDKKHALSSFSQADVNAGNICFVANNVIDDKTVDIALSVTDGEFVIEKALEINFAFKKSATTSLSDNLYFRTFVGIIGGGATSALFFSAGLLYTRSVRSDIDFFANRVVVEMPLDIFIFRTKEGSKSPFLHFIHALATEAGVEGNIILWTQQHTGMLADATAEEKENARVKLTQYARIFTKHLKSADYTFFKPNKHIVASTINCCFHLYDRVMGKHLEIDEAKILLSTLAQKIASDIQRIELAEQTTSQNPNSSGGYLKRTFTQAKLTMNATSLLPTRGKSSVTIEMK